MIPLMLLLAIAVFAFYFLSGTTKKKSVVESKRVEIDESLLEKNILFYAKLNVEEKKQFASDVQGFLQEVKIT